MDKATANGHLEIVKWLHENRSEGCSTNAMNRAASNSHLEVVQWLHENRKEGCTRQAMDLGARIGRLDILKWLHGHRHEGCSSVAMAQVACHGHIDVMQWLCETTRAGCAASTAVLPSQRGQTEALKWLHANNVHVEWTAGVMDAAGFLDALRWLHANRSEGCTTQAMDNVVSRNDFEAVLFLREHFCSVGCSDGAAYAAAALGHVAMFQWLRENYPLDGLFQGQHPHVWLQVRELSQTARRIHARQLQEGNNDIV